MYLHKACMLPRLVSANSSVIPLLPDKISRDDLDLIHVPQSRSFFSLDLTSTHSDPNKLVPSYIKVVAEKQKNP
jgi:hypothetical protein